MARDPFRTLLKIRRNAVEQARSDLAACLSAEAPIAARIKAIDIAAQRERDIWQDAHHFLEMSSIRLQGLRTERHAATVELAAAESGSSAARGLAAAARSGVEAVEQLAAERETVRQAEAMKREQHVLDDITRTRLPRPWCEARTPEPD